MIHDINRSYSFHFSVVYVLLLLVFLQIKAKLYPLFFKNQMQKRTEYLYMCLLSI